MARLALALVLFAVPAFAAEGRTCTAGSNGITRAVRADDDVRYVFCDGSVVVKHTDGSMTLEMALSGSDYDAFTAGARAKLESAQHQAVMLGTAAAKKQAADARAALETRVHEFALTYRWSKSRYFDAVKKSTVEVETARSALAP